MHTVTSKLPQVGTTIFTVMSQLAQEHQAINLSQGFPDYDIDPVLLDKVSFYHGQGYHQYAPMPGILPLRKQIAGMYAAQYHTAYDPDTEVLVTNGASEAIFSSMAALLQQGDEVIIFEPAYDLYTPVVTLFGAKVIPVGTFAPDFAVDWDAVATLCSDRTKLIIINNPNNPTGKMWGQEDFLALEQLVVRHPGLFVIADEVYGYITIGSRPFYSVSRFEQLKQRSIITASFGKLLHATGWKIGYCVAPAYLMQEIRKVHQFNVFAVNHALQHAIADYIADAGVYLGLPDYFRPKHRLLAEGLEQAGFEVLPADGTYFLLAGYRNLSDAGDTDFAGMLIREYGVAAIPVSAFYSDRYDGRLLRFCFAKKDETLQQAVRQLSGIKDRMRPGAVAI